ncbi:hypothetical protein C8J57DRAFT_1613795 [Mycena rebaudengoi]|nr:hypothetical protein C8J57DRAFT_1613795 [Mycena rebaudengoi]
MHLPLLACLGVLLLLFLNMPMLSSMAQRHVTSARMARNAAMSPIYSGSRSPRSSPGRRPLQDVSNRDNDAHPDSGSLERQRSVLRSTDCERQFALQFTPSRRERRVPNENRPASLTLGPSRPRIHASHGLLTPPTMNQEGAAGERRRRECEAEERRRNAQQGPTAPRDARATGQQERHRREAEERRRNAQQGPTAPTDTCATGQQERRRREAEARRASAEQGSQRARRQRERQQREN